MHEYAIQTRSMFYTNPYRTAGTGKGNGFDELFREIESRTSATETSDSVSRIKDRRGEELQAARLARQENIAFDPRAEAGETAEVADEAETIQYVFRPGFFENLQKEIAEEIANGRDPEVTLDGEWRWYDSLGNRLSEPIPLDIQGGWEFDRETMTWNWVGGENPYELYWLPEASGESQDDGTIVSGAEEDEAVDRGNIALQADSKYRFRPQFFETIMAMIEAEIMKGEDPYLTRNGEWRWYDSYGNRLPEPIPLDISGGWVMSEETGGWEWVGGLNPYDLYWLSDSDLVKDAEWEKAQSREKVLVSSLALYEEALKNEQAA